MRSEKSLRGADIRARYRELLGQHGMDPSAVGPQDEILLIGGGSRGVYFQDSQALYGASPRGGEIQLSQQVYAALERFLAGDRDADAIAAHHTMIHESVHGVGPMRLSSNDAGCINTLEELVTELVARRVSGHCGTSYQALVMGAVAHSGRSEVELGQRALADKRRGRSVETVSQRLAYLGPWFAIPQVM